MLELWAPARHCMARAAPTQNRVVSAHDRPDADAAGKQASDTAAACPSGELGAVK
jgi:hypothetical protein